MRAFSTKFRQPALSRHQRRLPSDGHYWDHLEPHMATLTEPATADEIARALGQGRETTRAALRHAVSIGKVRETFKARTKSRSVSLYQLAVCA